MKQFYRYVYDFPSKNANERFTPSQRMQHKMFSTLVKLTDELVPESKYKDLGIGIADWRYGMAEADDALLAMAGWSEESVKQIISTAGVTMLVQFPGKDVIAEDLRTFTDLKEVEPGLFLVAEAVTEGEFQRDAVYIDLR